MIRKPPQIKRPVTYLERFWIIRERPVRPLTGPQVLRARSGRPAARRTVRLANPFSLNRMGQEARRIRQTRTAILRRGMAEDSLSGASYRGQSCVRSHPSRQWGLDLELRDRDTKKVTLRPRAHRGGITFSAEFTVSSLHNPYSRRRGLLRFESSITSGRVLSLLVCGTGTWGMEREDAAFVVVDFEGPRRSVAGRMNRLTNHALRRHAR